MFNRKYIFNPGPFSIAMLDYQSVTKNISWVVPLPRNNHQDDIISLIGDPSKPLFATGTGRYHLHERLENLWDQCR